MSLIFQTPGGSAQFLSGAMLSDEVITPAISGAQNDFAPSGIDTATIIRVRASAAASLTGLKAPIGGAPAIRWISNDSAFNLTLVNASGASAEGNRFSTGVNLILTAGQVAGFLYNTRTALWNLFTVGSNPATPAPGAVVVLGAQETIVAAAGATNNVTPAAGITTLNRIQVDTAAGAANFTGLAAGTDGQIVRITNVGANDLTLNNQNAGSTAANRFYGVDDLILPTQGSALLTYDGTSLSRWVMG